MITFEEHRELVFNQRIGAECRDVMVHAALLVWGDDKYNTRDLNGKLFLFRHLKATVVSDEILAGSPLRSADQYGLIVSFAKYEEYNASIVNWVHDHYCPYERNINYSGRSDVAPFFYRYSTGYLNVVHNRRRSHIERFL